MQIDVVTQKRDESTTKSERCKKMYTPLYVPLLKHGRWIDPPVPASMDKASTDSGNSSLSSTQRTVPNRWGQFTERLQQLELFEHCSKSFAALRETTRLWLPSEFFEHYSKNLVALTATT